MAHHLVRYSIGANNEQLYPKSVSGVVWKSTVYHYTDRVMIGETDSDVAASGEEVVALKRDRAAKLAKEYRSSYPQPKELPNIIPSPRQVIGKAGHQERRPRKMKKA